MPTVTLHHGDCLAYLKTMGDNSVDAICTDPPAGISFMGKAWDHDKGGRRQWIAWLTEIMIEALRVTKPGGHALVWALPRTSHWTATALEDAGWEIRDVVTHLFGSGFPKSRDIGKAIDKAAGAEREVVGVKSDLRYQYSYENSLKGDEQGHKYGIYKEHDGLVVGAITAPATPEAAQWEGWGTALKPSSEHWILCRKPISEKTIEQNVLKWGTGAINIDAARIAGKLEGDPNRFQKTSGGWAVGTPDNIGFHEPPVVRAEGRWPTNTILSHTPACVPLGRQQVENKSGKAPGPNVGVMGQHGVYGTSTGQKNDPSFYGGEDGLETVEAWECTDDCPVKLLDQQAGKRSQGHRPRTATRDDFWHLDRNKTLSTESNNGYSDGSNASRFFYVAKPSRREKDAGVEGGNRHPTVKSVALMNHLLALIVPPNGVVLDMFLGSGTTGVAAVQRGVNFIGVEQDAESLETARQRIAHAEEELPIATPTTVIAQPARSKPKKRRLIDPNQVSLFGDDNAEE